MTTIASEGAYPGVDDRPTAEFLSSLDIVALGLIVVMSLGPLMTSFTLRVFS
jgi:hypothetical protein